MICRMTIRGSAVGSACEAIDHRVWPGCTTTEVRFWYTAPGDRPPSAACAVLAAMASQASTTNDQQDTKQDGAA